MKAFWWFKDDAIAGMARPGFNSTHFYDLAFKEMAVLGWLGRYSCGEVKFKEFEDHCHAYMPRVFTAIQMDFEEGKKIIEPLFNPGELEETLGALNHRTNFFKSFELKNDHLCFQLNFDHFNREIEFLKETGISLIVALTESHHQRDRLAKHFDVHHIAIPDMHAPELDQVKELAVIIDQARAKNKKVAVHCLAGIGRTSTMLVAAHVLLGEDLDQLKAELSHRNPSFKFHGPQAEFLDSLSKIS